MKATFEEVRAKFVEAHFGASNTLIAAQVS